MTDPLAGTFKAWDLMAHPMIVEELRGIAGKRDFTRADLPASGPLIINETIGRPWGATQFRRMWRAIAKKAGLPPAIQNRDSRPGAATEADVAGVPREKIQRALGHSRSETTDIYLREEVEVHRELAKLRAESRGSRDCPTTGRDAPVTK